MEAIRRILLGIALILFGICTVLAAGGDAAMVGWAIAFAGLILAVAYALSSHDDAS